MQAFAHLSSVSVLFPFQLCEEQNCQEEVSLLALSYMDRFLHLIPIRKTHLQILATACLLLASKLREPNYKALPVELLVFYTDHSITKKDLIVSIYVCFYFFYQFLRNSTERSVDLSKVT